MKTLKDFNFPTNEILTEMLKRVNAPEDFDFEQEKFYDIYSWSWEEYYSFAEWLANYIIKNKKIFKCGNKKIARKNAEWFLLDYGWKCYETGK